MAESGRIQLDDVRETVTCGICLQMLSDPRALTCGHTYCFPCLQGFQTTATRKECPICRSNTVPAESYLADLPKNKLAVDLVKLVHTYEPNSKEAPANWTNKPTKPQANGATRRTVDRLDARLERLNSLMSMLGGSPRRRQRSIAVNDGRVVHETITCDECRENAIRGERFKCGMCDDYDLCEKCEAKPRDTVHDVEHLFIKLKTPRTTDPPFRRVLHEDSTVMGMTQDSSQQQHVIEGFGRLCMSFKCDNCTVSPIVGTRFKCGVCAEYDLCESCEKNSSSIHDPKHVFIVLRHPVGFHTTVPQLTYSFYR